MSQTPITDKDPAATPAPALGSRTVGSLGWMLANTGLTRCASFLAQIVLGWLLSEEDFGIYALAISMATIGALLRDAGVRQVLVARQKEYSQLLGPVFWMALAFNSTAGILLGIAAPLAAIAYGEPSLVGLILLIAVTQPLSTPGAILLTRLQIDMRFRALAAQHIGSAIIRYGGAVAFALAGFGPLSFVLPLPVVAVYEGVLGWILTREQPWRCRFELVRWPGLFTQARWVLAGSFAIAFLNFGPNLAIGFFAQTAVVGLYFFAFQIIVQIGMLLSNNVSKVLLSALSKIATERERKREAVARALRHLMLLSAPMCVGLAVSFPSLEMLTWRGKWAEAANAVQALGAFYAIAILASVAQAAQQSRGDFRGAAAGMLVLATVSVCAAALGAITFESALGIAVAVGVARASATACYLVAAMKPLGIGPGRLAAAVLPAWLIACGAGTISASADMLAMEWHPAIRLMLVSGIFGMFYMAGVRVLLHTQIRELVTTLRGRPRTLAIRVLMLKSAARPGVGGTPATLTDPAPGPEYVGAVRQSD